VLAAYERDMKKLQWRAIPLGADSPHGRAFSRGGTDLLVFVFEDEAGSIVSIVESSSR
jgi:hypothetical protein